MISLDGLSHTGFDVEDLDRTEKFYTEVLGAKVEWKRETGRTRLMKLYVGNLGLSIPERPKGTPKPDVPFAIHFAYRADPEHALQYVEHVRSCGVEVDGPVGHGNEPQNVSWFFADPDGYRLEIEAHYATAEEALAVVETKHEERKPDLNLYHGGDALEELKKQQAEKARS
jgi:catechol 2,3-dioxygenase-like lactoylglutathione lyase family enzyme